MMAQVDTKETTRKANPFVRFFEGALESLRKSDSVLVVPYECRLRLYSQNDKRNGRAGPAMPEDVVQFPFVIRDSA